MSLLHRYEPPDAGVNDAPAVQGHWLGGQFRGNPVRYPYQVFPHVMQPPNAPVQRRRETPSAATGCYVADSRNTPIRGRPEPPRAAVRPRAPVRRFGVHAIVTMILPL